MKEIEEFLQSEGFTIQVQGDDIVCMSDDITRAIFKFKDQCSVYYFYAHDIVSSSSVSETGDIDNWQGLYLAAKAKATDKDFIEFLTMQQLQAEAQSYGAFH